MLVAKKTQFQPITLTLTLQSQEEVDCFYTLFNYNPIVYSMMDKGMQGNDFEKIRNALSNGCHNNKLIKAIKYRMDKL